MHVWVVFISDLFHIYQLTETEEIPEITVTDETSLVEIDQQQETQEVDTLQRDGEDQNGDELDIDIPETLVYEVQCLKCFDFILTFPLHPNFSTSS